MSEQHTSGRNAMKTNSIGETVSKHDGLEDLPFNNMSAQHTPGPKLSGTQEWALDWFKANGPAERVAYRNASITTGTVNSLIKAGLIERRSEQAPRWRITYAAIAKATGSAS
ncbi:hypothetical protein ACQ858_19665 [Variovorax ureilyticus]|uniref:hypothetical protein n=1 Tax=Variovorax ureilyticus TaxID=1836198 RepID=UPI003D664B87